MIGRYQGIQGHGLASGHFPHTCFFDVRTRSVLTDKFTSEDDDMSDKLRSRERYAGERTMRRGAIAS
jgi:hypothetical protein